MTAMQGLAVESNSESKLPSNFFTAVSVAPLAAFRIIFGFLVSWHCVSHICNGSVYRFFIEPPFTFNFIGFDFLQPLPGNGMYYFFAIMALLGLLIMFGAWYRLSICAFAIMWTITYLMQKVNYNNHYYLILLLSWMLAVVPANSFASLDARRNKSIQNTYCANWVYLLFISQIAIMYVYAGLGKFSEGWLSGKFIEIRFSKLALHPTLGFLYGNKAFQLFITYSGILFDLLLIPLLLWKKTRNWAIVFAILFHLFNAYTFRIGIFPFLSIGMLVFFVSPEKVKLFLNKILRTGNNHVQATFRKSSSILVTVLVYIAMQLLLPLRSSLYPGNVFWNEEGYRMSWRMMLRTKSGKLYFTVKDPNSGTIWKVNPSKYFTPVHVNWISGSPDMIWQYAQRIKKSYKEKGFPDVEIYAKTKVSLNRAPASSLIDSTINLANIRWSHFYHASWITD